MNYVIRTDFEIWLDNTLGDCAFAFIALVACIIAGFYASYYGIGEPFLMVIIWGLSYVYLMVIVGLFLYAAYVWSEW